MTRNGPVVLGAIILGVTISFGCRKKASDEIDFGTVEGSEYRNRYFGMTMSIPSDWRVQDRESTQRL